MSRKNEIALRLKRLHGKTRGCEKTYRESTNEHTEDESVVGTSHTAKHERTHQASCTLNLPRQRQQHQAPECHRSRSASAHACWSDAENSLHPRLATLRAKGFHGSLKGTQIDGNTEVLERLHLRHHGGHILHQRFQFFLVFREDIVTRCEDK